MDNQSKHGIFSSLLIVLALLGGIVVGLIVSYNNTQARLLHLAEQMNAPASKIDMALSLIDRYYVDSVATDSLVEQLLPDLMWYLDPHSVYIPASELNALNEPLDGEFDGIGVMFNMATDTIVVLNVIPQGPSQKAGIETPISAPTMEALSKKLYCFLADRIPIGIPSTSASRIAPAAISRVLGKRSSTCSITDTWFL